MLQRGTVRAVSQSFSHMKGFFGKSIRRNEDHVAQDREDSSHSTTITAVTKHVQARYAKGFGFYLPVLALKSASALITAISVVQCEKNHYASEWARPEPR